MLRIVHVSPGHYVSGTDSEEGSCFPGWASYPKEGLFVIVTVNENKIKRNKGRGKEETEFFHDETCVFYIPQLYWTTLAFFFPRLYFLHFF